MAKAGVRLKFEPSFKKNKIPAAKRRVANRQGALVRTIARRSIRKRKKISEPGKPPTSRTGILKRFIFYSWDPTLMEVVIGPEHLPGAKLRTPAVLEGTRRRGRFRARPYMQPALEKAKQALPELWRGAIK